VTAFFNIIGITSAYNDTNPADPDIWLVDVHQSTAITSAQNAGTPTAANGNGTGIRLDGSSNISLDGLQYNKMSGPGVFLNGSSTVTIDNSKLKSLGDERPNGDGIYAVNSVGIRVGGGADCPHNQPCNDLSYDDGFGIDLVNTHDVTIDAAAVSANDTGQHLQQRLLLRARQLPRPPALSEKLPRQLTWSAAGDASGHRGRGRDSAAAWPTTPTSAGPRISRSRRVTAGYRPRSPRSLISSWPSASRSPS
jgi:hypothetical protein